MIHFLLSPVILVKKQPKHYRRNSRRDGQARVKPHELRIDGDGDDGLAERATEGGLQQEHGHDEGFHGGWGFREGVFEAGDGGEDFREADEEVSGGLGGDVDLVGDCVGEGAESVLFGSLGEKGRGKGGRANLRAPS